VFLSGLLSKSTTSHPVQILSTWRNGGFSLVVSPAILRELVATLYDKAIPEEIILELISVIVRIGLHIPGAYETTKLNDIDPADNIFLAAAYESGADYLVSLDKKSLLPIKHYHGTKILTPELFVRSIMKI
jgi:putative PIN family toxin of toxin-antitoxin system